MPSVITRKPGHIPLNQSIARRWSGREEEAAGQQSELGAAKHLAVEPLPTIAVPFDRPLAPGPCHPSLDGGIGCAEPSGEASEGRQGAQGRTCQPGVELGRLALAAEGGEVLGEGHSLCQLGRQLGQLRQLVVIRCC